MAQKIDWQEQTPLNSDLSSSYLLWLLLSDIVSHVSPLLWPILSLRRFCKLSCSCKDTFQGIFAQLRKAGRWKHWRTKEKQRDNAQRRQLLGSKEHWAIHRSSWVYELSSQIFTFFVIFARVVTCADCPACVSCGMLSLTWFIAINFAAFKFTFWGGIPGEVAKPLPQEVTTRFLLQMTGTFVCVCVCPIRGWAKQWQDFSRYWKMHSNLPSCALSKWSKWLGFPVFHTGPYVETQTKLLSGTTSIIRQGPGELRS